MVEDTNFWSTLMGDDEHAAEYMVTYGEGPGCPTRMFLSSFINGGESVLDVGSGPSWNYEHFEQYGPRISLYKGYDYSPRFVRVANKRLGAEIIHLGDVRNIKEPNDSWDVVLLQDCLEHTNGYEKPIKEALRVAKKRVIVSFWHLEGNEGTEHINDDGNDGWGAWYDKTKWETFLNTLPYPWMDDELEVEGKTHKWNFYIISKDGK